jgi:hypothetical protein
LWIFLHYRIVGIERLQPFPGPKTINSGSSSGFHPLHFGLSINLPDSAESVGYQPLRVDTRHLGFASSSIYSAVILSNAIRGKDGKGE